MRNTREEDYKFLQFKSINSRYERYKKCFSINWQYIWSYLNISMNNNRHLDVVKISLLWIIIQSEVLYAAMGGDIVITEIHFKSDGMIYEYVELYNTTEAEIDLKNWELTGNGFTAKKIISE